MSDVNWDYTKMAPAYDLRPRYASEAIDRLVELSATGEGARCCDVGAGTGMLTRELLDRGLVVDAVEPNDEMRFRGRRNTCYSTNVRWFEGTAESTGMSSGNYAIVTFGSSFNVTDQPKALRETARLLGRRGWFACMWNHRDLADPLQAAIEAEIRSIVPGYSPGSRRSDQTGIIAASGLFEDAIQFQVNMNRFTTIGKWSRAWWSHATLLRQAGPAMAAVIHRIRLVVEQANGPDPNATLVVPYTTKVWMARRK